MVKSTFETNALKSFCFLFINIKILSNFEMEHNTFENEKRCLKNQIVHSFFLNIETLQAMEPKNKNKNPIYYAPLVIYQK